MIAILLIPLSITGGIFVSYLIAVGLAYVLIYGLVLICIFLDLMPAIALMLLFLGVSWLYKTIEAHWDAVRPLLLYGAYLILVFLAIWFMEVMVEHSFANYFSYTMVVLVAIFMLPALRLVAEKLGISPKSDCLFTFSCCLLSLIMTAFAFPNAAYLRSLELTLAIGSLAGAASTLFRVCIETECTDNKKGE